MDMTTMTEEMKRIARNEKQRAYYAGKKRQEAYLNSDEHKMYERSKIENKNRKEKMENSEDYKLWNEEQEVKYKEMNKKNDLIHEQIRLLQKQIHANQEKYYDENKDERKIFLEEFNVSE